MASFSAELRVSGLRFPLHSFDYEASQATDERGRVVAKVRRGLVSVTLDEPHTDFLLSWATDPHKRLATDVVVLNADGGQTLETLRMAGAYCVGHTEHFRAGNLTTGAYVVNLVLTDPDGWTLLVGGPAAYVTPAAREHGVPLPTEAQQLAAAVDTKKQRFAARMQLLRASKAKFAREMQQHLQAQPTLPDAPLPDATRTVLSGPAEALRQAAGQAIPPLPKDLVPAALAIDRLDRNNLAVEMAKLADDSYFNDTVADSDGNLNPVHFANHNPDGTYFLNDAPEGWLVKQVFKGDDSGFMALLYQSTFEDTPRNVLAFRGTDADPNFMDELKLDAETDGLQGTGEYTKAFEETAKLAWELQARF